MNIHLQKDKQGTLHRAISKGLPYLTGSLLVAGVLLAQKAIATPLIGGPSGTLTLTVNAGPLLVSSPGRFGITGILFVPRVGPFPGVYQVVTVAEPGDYRFSMFAENPIDSRRSYSLSLSDRSATTPVQYTLRFELLPGSCPAVAAVSNNVQLLAVAGRQLEFSVLRRPKGNSAGPQLISNPRVICVNPEAEARLIFNPYIENFLPVELQTTNGSYSSITELSIPL